MDATRLVPAVLLITLLLTPIVAAQDARTRTELAEWHGKIVAKKGVASLKNGKGAVEWLDGQKLNVEKLGPELRSQYLQLQVVAALASGDAARAAESLPALMRHAPNDRETLKIAWMVATAAGNGQLGSETLERLGANEFASTKAIKSREKRLRMVGHASPMLDVKTDVGRTVHLRERMNTVLVLDFWNTARLPGEKTIRALKNLRNTLASEPNAEMLGINSDSSIERDEANTFAVDNGYRWPQHYEGRLRGSPLTDEGFHVATMPWQVIIDGAGNVRAVGSVTETGFVYAIRATIAEANGRFEQVVPKTVAGELAPGRFKVRITPTAKRDDKAEGKKELPHNADAKALLDRARTYLKTGMKKKAKALLQEIVAKYPGTWEAQEAKRRLEYL